MRNAKCHATVCCLSLLGAACSAPRGSPLSLPTVMVQHNPDGTQTRHVNTGRRESQAALERRLLSSIECPNYEIVATGQRTEPGSDSLYWVRYRCLGE